MTKSLILKTLKYVISLLLGIIIIYFLFRNQDPVKLIEEAQKVEVQWVVWSMIFGALALNFLNEKNNFFKKMV